MGYPSDLSDKRWDLIKDHLSTGKYGNRAMHNRRRLVDEILYVVKAGANGPCYSRISGRGRWSMAIFVGCRSLDRVEVLADLVKMKGLKSGRREHPQGNRIEY